MGEHELELQLPGLGALRQRTLGRPDVRVAVLDGPVDGSHASLRGARILTPLSHAHPPANHGDALAKHGTHVTSVICAQPTGSADGLEGIAPGLTVLSLPVFSEGRPRATQIDLARAIEASVAAGAHIINLSAGQYTDAGEAHDLLEGAARHCAEEGVLLVAAAGNDGCECLHVPAALPSTLAVGALSRTGGSMDFSNWGAAYRRNGIMAPGEDVLGAMPGGGVFRASGTSAAAPIVTAVAALLVSLQLDGGGPADALVIRGALLRGAAPCTDPDDRACRRLLAGVLDIEGALKMMDQEAMNAGTTEVVAPNDVMSVSTSCACSEGAATGLAGVDQLASRPEPPVPVQVGVSHVAAPPAPAVAGDGIRPSSGNHDEPALVYVLGSLGYDFGTEARRDAFKQLMAPAMFDGLAVPANPHDPRQMVRHLEANPSESQSLIWTVDLELTPLYALEATGPYATDVYGLIRGLYTGQIAGANADDYVERVSIPGRMAGRSIRLFSGQVVPVVEIDTTRGMFGWRSNQLVRTAVEHVNHGRDESLDTEGVARALVGFLDKVYYEYRNLGVLSRDRALNFAATNAFQAAIAFADAVAEGMQLDIIDVEPSPYARSDADAWDVKLKFFDPENLRRARRVYRFTVDVSETMPVTMGEVRAWSASM